MLKRRNSNRWFATPIDIIDSPIGIFTVLHLEYTRPVRRATLYKHVPTCNHVCQLCKCAPLCGTVEHNFINTPNTWLRVYHNLLRLELTQTAKLQKINAHFLPHFRRTSLLRPPLDPRPCLTSLPFGATTRTVRTETETEMETRGRGRHRCPDSPGQVGPQ